MRADETAAAEIVAAYLNGDHKPRDVEGAGDSTYDFDVVLTTGRRVALEVTAAADQDRLSLDAAAFGKDWIEPSLGQDWWVVLSRRTVGPEIRLYRLMKQIVPLLEVFERYEVPEVNRDRLQAQREAVTSELIETRQQFMTLGGNVARSNGPRRLSKGGQVLLSFSHGFSSDAGQANALVLAAAESNREKLAAADADERHLFIWMDPSYSSAEAAVSLGRPLAAPANLPSEIDAVWLGTLGVPNFGAVAFAGVGVLALWRVRPPAADWESMPLRVLAQS